MPPWLWMDVSTSYRSRSGQMNGTLRVEQSYIRTLSGLIAPQLRFCRYDPLVGQFVSVSQPPDLASKGSPPKAQKRVSGLAATIKPMGKKIERAVRTSVRAAAAPLVRRVMSAEPMPQLGGDGCDEVLFLSGENWSRHDFNVLAEMRRTRGTKIAALCQDFIPIMAPQFFPGGEFVDKFEAYAQFLVREVDLIVSNSQSTKHDVLRYAGGHGGLRGSIRLVEHGADLVSSATVRRPPALSDLQAKRFVLSVSTIQSRKNFDLLYHLWHRLTAEGTQDLPTLVIVGQPGFGSSDLMWQIARDPVTKNSIVHLGRAGDDELAWLYQHCLFTLYPSFYEGWGLPVAESLAFGKYCLAANTSSLPEAGAGLAGHLDPLDLPAWRRAVLDLIKSPEQLARHEAAIRAGYRPVTWAQSAAQLVEALYDLAARRR